MPWRGLICCIVLAIALPVTALAGGARIGEVKTAEGAVTIERNGATRAATAGTDLFEADVVRTGADGAVGMSFTDNSRLSLGPSSELALEKYLFSNRQKAFDARLAQGSMTASSGQIAKTPMAMRILMPTGILGVRGTEFVVRVNP